MRRPRGRGAEGVLAARTRLIKLVLPGRQVDGARAVAICDAIEMLERAAYREGRRRGDELDAAPASPVTAAELVAVKEAIADWDRRLRRAGA